MTKWQRVVGFVLGVLILTGISWAQEIETKEPLTPQCDHWWEKCKPVAKDVCVDNKTERTRWPILLNFNYHTTEWEYNPVCNRNERRERIWVLECDEQ